MTSKIALMVCTHALGGMRSVVEGYKRDSVFVKWNFQSLWTHREGSVLTRSAVALKAYIRLLWLLLLGRVSFMHVHAAMRGSFWRKSFFVATARLFGVPSILHLHGSEMETFYGSLSASRKLAVKRALEKVEAVVVLSNSWRDFVLKISPYARVVVINNYVLLPEIEVNPTQKSDKFEVLFLGVLGHRKGVYDLLDCWKDVVAAVPNAKLLIGGNGDIEQAKQLAENLGISESVDFLGWVGGEHKIRLLRQADAFVLPSYNEGLPMSVLEAMSWQLPVVTTKVGGIPELIEDNNNGLLIDAGDKAALSSALIRLGQNVEFRNTIGAAGRKRIVSGFSNKSVLPQLDMLYQDILSSYQKN